MIDTDALIQARYRHSRPGLELVAIEEAALPVTVVGVEVLAQERKPLPLLDEFVLRLVAAGLETTADIGGFLGLELPLVSGTVADEITSGNLRLDPARSRVSLTSLGRESVRDLESVQPVQRNLPIVFDRLTWSMASYSRSDLITKHAAEEAGMIVLPASKSARISADDITVPGVNALIRTQSSGPALVEVLSVKKLSPNTHRFLPVRLLVFGDAERGDVEVAICVDGDMSDPHELSLNMIGGAEQLGIKVAAPELRAPLSEHLEEIRVPADLVTSMRAWEADVQATDVPGAAAASPDLTSSSKIEVSELPVRSVSVFEHRELLAQALESARTRLLIVAPWVKSGVVSTDFLGSLERRLRSGVRVDIAHGYGDDDSGSDKRALERLGNLQRRFPDAFGLERLTNTHAKILIFDNVWVSTSFNWLSFRGDPDRTYRMEEGTLVRIPDVVDAEYAKYLQLIEKQRIEMV